MASKNEHRKQKNAEKKKLRDRERRAVAARTREQTRQLSGATAEEAVLWPIADCYISQNWPDQGPTIHAVLTRKHAGGTVAAALFEIDLAEKGVLSAELMIGVEPIRLYAELERRSQPISLLIVDEGMVVKAVQEGSAFGVKQGHPQPENLAEVMALFGDAKPAPQQLLTGTGKKSASEATEEGGGFFSSLRRKLGF